MATVRGTPDASLCEGARTLEATHMQTKNKNNKNKKASKIYTELVWTPLRKEGLAQYANTVMNFVPKAPVVMSMAKKNKVGKIDISFGAITVTYPSWKDLRDGYENLILAVADWVQSFDERKQ